MATPDGKSRNKKKNMLNMRGVGPMLNMRGVGPMLNMRGIGPMLNMRGVGPMLRMRGEWETRGTSLPQLFHYFLYRK